MNNKEHLIIKSTESLFHQWISVLSISIQLGGINSDGNLWRDGNGSKQIPQEIRLDPRCHHSRHIQPLRVPDDSRHSLHFPIGPLLRFLVETTQSIESLNEWCRRIQNKHKTPCSEHPRNAHKLVDKEGDPDTLWMHRLLQLVQDAHGALNKYCTRCLKF